MRQSFTAKIQKIGINPYVAVPAGISRAFGRRRYVPVRGAVNAFPIRTTLVPTGAGRHRIYVNGEMRKGARVGVGGHVRVALEIDRVSREVPIPRELAAALRRNKAAACVFAALPPSHRRDYLLYLNWLKTPEALRRNVRKVIAHLLSRRGKESGRGVGSVLARPMNSSSGWTSRQTRE